MVGQYLPYLLEPFQHILWNFVLADMLSKRRHNEPGENWFEFLKSGRHSCSLLVLSEISMPIARRGMKGGECDNVQGIEPLLVGLS